MNELTFVLIQWTVLCVQFIGIPVLLLALIAEECLSPPTPRTGSAQQALADRTHAIA